MNSPDVTQRFSNRVADYVRYRPDYPTALIDWLREKAGVAVSSNIADIGAGTGISAKLFLDAGHEVTAVEPNTPMRTASEHWLGTNPHFHAVDGRAEATTLPDASIDVISVAQAFHWFDTDAVRREWKRILRPGGLVVIYWNSRRLSGTPFLQGYEKLLHEFGTDYASVSERYADDATMKAWFGPGLIATARFDHHQIFDFAGLRGRLESSSYAPAKDHPKYEPMITALRSLFDAAAQNNRIEFLYDTRAFVGRLT